MTLPENLASYTKLQDLQSQIDQINAQKKTAEDQWADLIE